MRYKIQGTFTCEVEADNMDMAFAEASNVYVLNENHSDAIVERDESYEMEAWEIPPIVDVKEPDLGEWWSR